MRSNTAVSEDPTICAARIPAFLAPSSATVALDGAKNAGILAAQIVGSSDAAVLERIVAYKESLKEKVLKGAEEVKAKYAK